MKNIFLFLSSVFVSLFAFSGPANAATCGSPITVTGATTGTVINVTFDTGCTTERADTIEAAAQVWADYLDSDVTIEINMVFAALTCSTSSGVLGSAGAAGSSRDFSGAPLSGTWYPIALANALYGSDLDPGNPDINATFNSEVGTSSCLSGASWYYHDGSGTATGSQIDFYETVLHEIAHGLGFYTLLNSAGQKAGGYDDHYLVHLQDNSSSTNLKDMASDGLRAAAILDTGDLVWSGAEVTAESSFLTSGLTNGKVRMYAPSSYESGSSVSHFDTVLDPNEVMEPMLTGSGESYLTKALFKDIGWPVAATLVSNSAPVITGQNAITIDEDNSYTLSFSDITVTDSDHTVPTDHTLTVSAGSNYSVSGSTVTPDADFNGSLTVPVTVNDGIDDSNTFNLSVTVNAVNDKPEVTGQSALDVDEDNSLTLTLGDLTVTDVDNSYPTGFALSVATGPNYTVSGSTITPTANFNGTLTVAVTVNDGSLTSDSFDVSVTVNSINDLPSITSASSATGEVGTSFNFNVLATDVENSVNYGLSSAPSWLSIGFTSGVMSGTPDTDGTFNFDVLVSDGVGQTTQSFALTVDPAPVVNSAPVITGQNAITIDEDNSYTLSFSDITVTDSDHTVPTDHTLSVATGTNYSVSGNTITPDVDFNGTLTIPVTVNDGSDDSNTFNVSVTVSAVNDVPTITDQSVLGVNEDSSLTLTLDDLTVSDPDNSYPTGFSLMVSSGTNYSVVDETITPSTDFNGDLTVPVKVNDGTSDSATYNVTITVHPVNDQPVISGQSALSLDEDGSLTIALANLTVSDPDNSYPADFSLNVASGANYSVSGNTVSPDADFNGTLSVPVTVNDGLLDSDMFNLSITVNSINDLPVITSANNASGNVGASFNFNVTATDVENIVNYGLSGAPTWLAMNFTTGVMSGVPDIAGTYNFNVLVSDGTDEVSQSFELTVGADPNSNSAPVIVGQNPLTVPEDGSIEIVVSDLIITDADNLMDDISLSLAAGINYSISGSVVMPDADFNGTITVPVVASDGIEDSNSFNVEITVSAVNDAPVISSANTLSVALDDNINFEVEASDVDSSITYGLSGAPSWLSIGYNNGELSGTAEQAGTFNFEILVSDGEHDTMQAFTVTVTASVIESDLSISSNPQQNLADAGDSIRIVYTLNNSGPSDTSGTVNISLDGFSITDTSGECSTSSSRVQCLISTLSNGASAQVWIELTSDTASSVDVVAEFENAGTEANSANNSVSSSVSFADPAQEEPETTISGWGEANTRAMAVADIQGDSKPEIILANGPGETSSIFRFNGTYSAVVPHSYLYDSADSYSLAIADFDGNNTLDIVLANGSDEANTVWQNDGQGYFAPAASLGASESRDVALGDFDGNGAVDLVFANAGNQANTVYLNDGNGNFTLAAELGQYDSRAVFVFDFDFDGDDDIFVANYGYYNLLYINQRVSSSPQARTGLNGNGFDNSETVNVGSSTSQTNDVNILDADNDGVWDKLVVANVADESNSSIEIYELDSTQSDVELTETLDAGNSQTISAGDYDGDGDPDLAVMSENGVVQVMLQDNQGNYTPGPVLDSSSGSSVLLEDLDGNGEADLLVGNNDGSGSDLHLLGAVASGQSDSSNQQNTQTNNTTSGSSKGGATDGLFMFFGILLLILKSRRQRFFK